MDNINMYALSIDGGKIIKWKKLIDSIYASMNSGVEPETDFTRSANYL